MDEAQLMEVLGSYKAVLDALIEKVDNIGKEVAEYREMFNGRLDGLEKTLFDDILKPAQEAMAENEKENRFTDFQGRYAEKFAPVMDDVKKIEGDDYDILRNTFDEYDALEGEKPDEAAYVDTVFNKVVDQINVIREKYGAEKIEIKADENGEVEVKADGKDVTDEVTGGEGGEEKPGKEKETEKVEISETGEDNPEDIAAFEKELEAYKG